MNVMILYKEEVYNIVGAAMEVHSHLGPGFFEAVYQEAFEMEINFRSIPYLREEALDIYYKGVKLKKKYVPDFICYDSIIVEMKAVSVVLDVHLAQLLNYLKASKMRVGVLINFGETSLSYKRMIY